VSQDCYFALKALGTLPSPVVKYLLTTHVGHHRSKELGVHGVDFFEVFVEGLLLLNVLLFCLRRKKGSSMLGTFLRVHPQLVQMYLPKIDAV